jgi:hypothetical protein
MGGGRGFIKQKVAQKWYISSDDLKEVIRKASASITPAMLSWFSDRTWTRIILCHENGCAHTDTLE